MHLFSLNTTVGWLGPNCPQTVPSDLTGWHLVPVPPGSELAQVDLLVVETCAFERIRDCERFVNRQACPVLYMTSPQHLTTLVNQLQAKDDICLAAPPLPLLATRLGKMHQTQRAMIDPLTGAQRREAYFNYLRHWGMNARRSDPLSLLLLDLDNFKTLNDQFGQDAGDDVLQRLGMLLRQHCSDSPLIARMGGQEFAILLAAPDHHAAEVAEQLRQQIASPGLHPHCATTASIGVASRQDVQHVDQLHRVSDEAVFAAKAAGRNRVCVYSQLNTQSMLNGEDLDLVSLENKSRVLGERVTNYIAQRSRRILQNLRSEAETDGLTQFYNRRYLDRRLELQFRHHQESGQPLCLALIDLDHFGRINKAHGWPTGDHALRTLCDVIRNHIRKDNDWVGRYGGEEFFVVLPDVVLDDAINICERLRNATAAAEISSTSGTPLNLTISIGLVQCDAADDDIAGLLDRVSEQTLRAKENGRNQTCWAPLREPAPTKNATDGLTITA
ncbi:GGDEF domain-containing protein [Roseimaritima ulvae]|uniref:diguanylate cyclase n=1 Tax=Roseimaritima ulvae TaxID=980254 RepID=A0A5B9R8I2_9BACT|nr:diguanylate cyclase [Roseimaritima ulvae]QEG42923.1 Response regulator PleD [Roseimaritima ulvae]